MDLRSLLLRHTKTPESEVMESHLQTGNAVEVVEQDKLSIVQGEIKGFRISEDMILFEPKPGAVGESMLVETRRVRPVSGVRSYDFTEIQDITEFQMYEIVDVWVEEKWLVGVIVHVPIGTGDTFSIHILRDDSTISVWTKIRRHLVWDNINGWTDGICTPNQLEVGLVGRYKTKILQYVGDEHVLVQYMDLIHADRSHPKEIIKRKKWHRSILRRRWEELMAWINADDPALEFGCYMPAYICLGILGSVSPILFTDSAQHWPENSVALFYTFGGISFFLCIFILIGLMCRQPKTRAELNRWRAICITAVLTGVVFVVLHAVYGRLDLVESRKPKGQGTDVVC